tara:strand:+ start:2988 stop:3296 length:309 start_codon:yes stop_codon:yes gene_type:complete
LQNQSKEEIIASSSIWVAIILNLIPGIGTGYIYQRRWKAYWITTVSAGIWLAIDFYNQLSLDPNDPSYIERPNSNFIGLFIISIITSIEAYISIKNERLKLD